MNPTIHSSTSGLPFERETPYQQRGYGNPTFFAGTTAYTQYGAEETVGLEHQRPSADILSTYRSNREEHKLLGVGSQFQTGNAQHESRPVHVDEAYTCPYHGPLLQERLMNSRSSHGLNPMDRYLAEGPSERYAIIARPDASEPLFTYKSCRCIEMMQSSIDTNEYAQK